MAGNTGNEALTEQAQQVQRMMRTREQADRAPTPNELARNLSVRLSTAEKHRCMQIGELILPNVAEFGRTAVTSSAE